MHDVTGGNDDEQVLIVSVLYLAVLYLFVHTSRSVLSVLLTLLTRFLKSLRRFDVVCQRFDQMLVSEQYFHCERFTSLLGLLLERPSFVCVAWT